MSSTVWEATGIAERYAALEMLKEVSRIGWVTVAGDKGFDTADFVPRVPEPARDAARGAKPGTK